MAFIVYLHMGYIHRLLRLGEGKAKARAKSFTNSLILGPRCVYTCHSSGRNVPTQVYIPYIVCSPPSHTLQVALISDITTPINIENFDNTNEARVS